MSNPTVRPHVCDDAGSAITISGVTSGGVVSYVKGVISDRSIAKNLITGCGIL